MSPTPRVVAPRARVREAVIAAVVGLGILGLIASAVINMTRQVNATGRVEGVIVAKHFVPQPEEQISVGQAGLKTKQIAGEYSFEVQMPQEGGKVYKVLVGPRDYAARQVGERFSFYRE